MKTDTIRGLGPKQVEVMRVLNQHGQWPSDDWPLKYWPCEQKRILDSLVARGLVSKATCGYEISRLGKRVVLRALGD